MCLPKSMKRKRKWSEWVAHSFKQIRTKALSCSNVFLDTSSHLYKRVCPSVHPSVGPLASPSVNLLRLCKKMCLLALFRPRRFRTPTEMISKVVRDAYFDISFYMFSSKFSIHSDIVRMHRWPARLVIWEFWFQQIRLVKLCRRYFFPSFPSQVKMRKIDSKEKIWEQIVDNLNTPPFFND